MPSPTTEVKYEQPILVEKDQIIQDDELRAKYYDTVIAPALLEVAKLCAKQVMPFVLGVAYTDKDIGEVGINFPSAPVVIIASRAVLHSGGDLDTLLLAVIDTATKEGHNSDILEQVFKIPKAPKKAD